MRKNHSKIVCINLEVPLLEKSDLMLLKKREFFDFSTRSLGFHSLVYIIKKYPFCIWLSYNMDLIQYGRHTIWLSYNIYVICRSGVDMWPAGCSHSLSDSRSAPTVLIIQNIILWATNKQ